MSIVPILDPYLIYSFDQIATNYLILNTPNVVLNNINPPLFKLSIFYEVLSATITTLIFYLQNVPF